MSYTNDWARNVRDARTRYSDQIENDQIIQEMLAENTVMGPVLGAMSYMFRRIKGIERLPLIIAVSFQAFLALNSRCGVCNPEQSNQAIQISAQGDKSDRGFSSKD